MIGPESVIFAIPTMGRPRHLAKAVASYASNFRRHGVFPRILISNNDPNKENRSVYAGVVGLLREAYKDFDITYVDAVDHGLLTERLSEMADIPSGLVRRLIGDDSSQTDAASPRYGANRNVILAMTRGSLVIFADDDTLLPSLESATSTRDSCMPYFGMMESFPHGETPMSGVLVDFFRENIQHFDLGAPHIARALGHQDAREDRERVVVSSFGSVGDSGWQDNLPLLLSRHEETLNFASGLSDAAQMMTSCRQIYRAPARHQLTPPAGLMSMSMCIDNRGSVPCFFPCGRGEDDIFAAALRCTSPKARMVHVAHVVQHVPGLRHGSAASMKISSQSLMVSMFDCASMEGVSGLPDAIEMVRDLTRVSSRAFVERCAHVATIAMHSASNRLMENLAVQPKGSPSWKRVIARLLFDAEEVVYRLSREPERVLEHYCGGVGVLRAKTDLLLECLEYWPAIAKSIDEHVSADGGRGFMNPRPALASPQ